MSYLWYYEKRISLKPFGLGAMTVIIGCADSVIEQEIGKPSASLGRAHYIHFPKITLRKA